MGRAWEDGEGGRRGLMIGRVVLKKSRYTRVQTLKKSTVVAMLRQLRASKDLKKIDQG